MDKQRTILFVDDEQRVLKSLERALLDEPYDCLFATNGRQALAQYDVNVDRGGRQTTPASKRCEA